MPQKSLYSPSKIEEYLIIVGQRLRQARQRARLTQFSLASRAGVDLRNYQNIESGKSEFRIRTLVKIAEALNTEIAELLSPSVASWLDQPYEAPTSPPTQCPLSASSPEQCATGCNKCGNGIAVIGCNSVYQFVNATWATLMHRHEADVVGRLRAWEIFPSPYDQAVKASFATDESVDQPAPFVFVHQPIPDKQRALYKVSWRQIPKPSQQLLVQIISKFE